jgi:hypothetical protein
VRAVRASSATPSARARTAAVSLKAAGAFERNLARIADGYTAAAVLASGGAVGTVREKLRALVLADVDTDAAGDTSLKVRPGVVRADGVAPSVHEATALAVLALAGDEKAPLAELGSSLMAGYSPAWGWGDGRANLVALRAVTTLFKERLPSAVRVTLERDGVALAESSLGADKLKEVLTVTASAAGSAGPHRWTVRADPAVPGLGFALTLSAWVPWKDEPGGGLELTVEVPEELRVGVASALTLTAAAPSGVETVLRLNLPAGVQPDGASLEALVRASTVRRYETEDGAVRLYLPAAQSGSSWTGELKVVPTLEGRLQSGASQLAPEGKPALARSFAPRTWVIRSSAEHSSAP